MSDQDLTGSDELEFTGPRPWPNKEPVPDGVVEVSQDPDFFAADEDEEDDG